MPQEPFVIPLGDGSQLGVERIIRWMPGKRLVAKAVLNQKTILLKIFHDKRGCVVEQRGYQQLEQAQIKTPKQITNAALAAVHGIAYNYLDDLLLFKDAWKTTPHKHEHQLQELLFLLQQMYLRGIYQKDLHLGNFAYCDSGLLALDPASCTGGAQQKDIQENLALLVAQFPLSEQPIALKAICQMSLVSNERALTEAARRQWKKRLAIFLKKIYRECTYIKCSNTKSRAAGRLHVRCVRQDFTNGMNAALDHIEDPPADAVYLKQGGSSSVYSINVDRRCIAIKHVRNKNIGRLLRRCWRQSRASKAWYFSHLLGEAGIGVPRPIAMVERKVGPLVMESWYISEYVEAETLYHRWHREAPSAEQIAQTRHFFDTLKLLKTSHGDMKATNLLLAGGRLLVIDYDGMQEHFGSWLASRRHKEDLERFLQNWPGQDIAALIT